MVWRVYNIDVILFPGQSKETYSAKRITKLQLFSIDTSKAIRLLGIEDSMIGRNQLLKYSQEKYRASLKAQSQERRLLAPEDPGVVEYVRRLRGILSTLSDRIRENLAQVRGAGLQLHFGQTRILAEKLNTFITLSMAIENLRKTSAPHPKF